MAAVSKNGGALYYAADPLKADKEIVKAAVLSKDADALKFAAEDLRAEQCNPTCVNV